MAAKQYVRVSFEEWEHMWKWLGKMHSGEGGSSPREIPRLRDWMDRKVKGQLTETAQEAA